MKVFNVPGFNDRSPCPYITWTLEPGENWQVRTEYFRTPLRMSETDEIDRLQPGKGTGLHLHPSTEKELN
jgi:hypothetical protein